MTIRNFRRNVFFALLCCCLAGCPTPRSTSTNPSSPSSAGIIKPSKTSPRLQSHSPKPRELLSINSLLVLPVEYNARTRDLGADGVGIDTQLEAAVQRELDIKIFNKTTYGKVLPPTLGRNDVVAWARRVGADGVLITRLQNFVERSGSAVGGDPGTVHFEMTVMRVSDMQDVWTADYHFRDEALTDNIFRLREKFDRDTGPGWKRAQDVLDEGFATALKDLATMRLAQFSAKS